MNHPPRILKVAVPAPLYQSFDYLAPANLATPLQPGMRLRIPFGRRRLVGVLLDVVSHSDLPNARLKAALDCLDDTALLPDDLLNLARWASAYYHHPVGEVMQQLLPPGLRRGQPGELSQPARWRITESGAQIHLDTLKRAPRQRSLLTLAQTGESIDESALEKPLAPWRQALHTLEQKGWLRQETSAPAQPAPPQPQSALPELNAEQARAVDEIVAALGTFATFLLDGVTGSGKTEVYLRAAQQALALGRQVLVLVPEIGLTPQFVQRFTERFGIAPVVLHSNLSEGERSRAWLAAREGSAQLILGTRSAVFTPMAAPGLIIVDEEHDPSFKQQDGFRYSARDLAVVRAKNLSVPVVLGSATPSLETLYNADSGRYRRLELPKRARAAATPTYELLDIRGQKLKGKLSPPLLGLIKKHLDAQGQVLVFLNRRGFAPSLLCHDCGWLALCKRCDVRFTFHRRDNLLRCHHCGAEQRPPEHCAACGSTALLPLGLGTERIDEELSAMFPEANVLRIDRDTTRRRGAMSALMQQAHGGEHRILVGTQMLAKGHDFPDITLVAVVDIDQGLFSADFRGPERMAQLLIQVAGRAGRADKPGHVAIQTHHPEHPLFRTLLGEGYHAMARAALEERKAAQLPPFTAMALFRAEATHRERPVKFLSDVQQILRNAGNGRIELAGPIPAPMEKRAGKFRYQLMIQASQRGPLHHALEQAMPQIDDLPSARGVRWSLDVDPVDAD